MNNKITLNLHKELLSSGMSLSFKGVIDVEMVDHILEAMQHRLERSEFNSGTRKKVYLVLVECLQNLCKQIDELGDLNQTVSYQTNVATLNIVGNEKVYHIATSNFISNKKVEKLKAWLEKIQTCNKSQLKELYNSILTNHTFSESGGAGLGFIDIALKTNNLMYFHFEPYDDQFSFFSISVMINKNLEC